MTRAPRRSLRAALTLCLAAGLVTLAGCKRTPDEALIRDNIAAMAEALEKKEAGAFLDPVADDYHDRDGRDRRGLRQLLAVHFLRHKDIGVTIADVSVEFRDGGTALARLHARAVGADGLITDRHGGVYRVQTHWRKKSGDWQLIYAEWEPLVGGR
jgi:hypothetical protein